MASTSLFIVDSRGDNDLLNKQVDNVNISTTCSLLDVDAKTKLKDAIFFENKNDAESDDEDYFGLPPPNVDLKDIIRETLAAQALKEKFTKSDQEASYANKCVDEAEKNAQARKNMGNKKYMTLDHSDYNPLTKTFDVDSKLAKVNVEKELTNTKMSPDLEQQKDLPVLRATQRKKLNRLEREKSKGAGWYGLPAQELTEELENDLKILQMRSALDPKHFYKKNDLKVLPKYFQVGTVLHSPLDFYNERNTRRNKKKSLVDELLADAEFQKFNKRKYKEIMSRRDYYSRRKALKKLKKLKQ